MSHIALASLKLYVTKYGGGVEKVLVNVLLMSASQGLRLTGVAMSSPGQAQGIGKAFLWSSVDEGVLNV